MRDVTCEQRRNPGKSGSGFSDEATETNLLDQSLSVLNVNTTSTGGETY